MGVCPTTALQWGLGSECAAVGFCPSKALQHMSPDLEPSFCQPKSNAEVVWLHHMFGSRVRILQCCTQRPQQGLPHLKASKYFPQPLAMPTLLAISRFWQVHPHPNFQAVSPTHGAYVCGASRGRFDDCATRHLGEERAEAVEGPHAGRARPCNWFHGGDRADTADLKPAKCAGLWSSRRRNSGLAGADRVPSVARGHASCSGPLKSCASQPFPHHHRYPPANSSCGPPQPRKKKPHHSQRATKRHTRPWHGLSSAQPSGPFNLQACACARSDTTCRKEETGSVKGRAILGPALGCRSGMLSFKPRKRLQSNKGQKALQ